MQAKKRDQIIHDHMSGSKTQHPKPDSDFTNLRLDQLKALIADSSPENVEAIAHHWDYIHEFLVGTGGLKDQLDTAVTQVLTHWTGTAADTFAKEAASISTQITTGATYLDATSTALKGAASSLREAKHAMADIHPAGEWDSFWQSAANDFSPDDTQLKKDLADPRLDTATALALNHGELSMGRLQELKGAVVMEALAGSYKGWSGYLNHLPFADDGFADIPAIPVVSVPLSAVDPMPPGSPEGPSTVGRKVRPERNSEAKENVSKVFLGDGEANSSPPRSSGTLAFPENHLDFDTVLTGNGAMADGGQVGAPAPAVSSSAGVGLEGVAPGQTSGSSGVVDGELGGAFVARVNRVPGGEVGETARGDIGNVANRMLEGEGVGRFGSGGSRANGWAEAVSPTGEMRGKVEHRTFGQIGGFRGGVEPYSNRGAGLDAQAGNAMPGGIMGGGHVASRPPKRKPRGTCPEYLVEDGETWIRIRRVIPDVIE